MPLPNNQYYPLFPMQEQLINSTDGTALAAGIVSFYQDQNRTVPKDVYQRTENPDNTFTYTSLGNVLQLSAIGTFVDQSGNNIIPFLWPFTGSPNISPPSTEVELYYIVVQSSGDVPQFTVSAWPPEVVGGSSGGNNFGSSDNQISNPQFAIVNFTSPHTFTVSGSMTTEIAPDWSVITTGTGTFTVTQRPDIDLDAPGGPAFGLEITSVDVDSIMLNQRIAMSPRLLESGFASGGFIAEAGRVSTPAIQMNFVPSNPSMAPVPIVSGAPIVGSFEAFYSTVDLSGVTKNSDPGNIGYVDIQLILNTGFDVQISCVQLISVASLDITPDYIQESTPRQIDHLFHYYQPPLNFKPIPSLLTGWDFPLNPQQFGVTSFTTTPIYVWDQTICASAVTTFNVTSPVSLGGGFVATSTGATDAFYMLQYISGAQALETALGDLSVNIAAYSSVNPGVIARVYLYTGNLSSTIPVLPTSLGTLTTSPSVDGTFTLSAANWSQILQTNGQSNQVTLLQNALTDFGFNGFNNFANYGATANFAIVVTFFVPTSGTSTVVQSVSVVPGVIPTRPAPQTADEVLRECEVYYQSSFNVGVTPAQAVGLNTGEVNGVLGVIAGGNLSGPFSKFSVPMRSTPNMIFYNPVSNNAFIRNITGSSDFSSTSGSNITTKGFYSSGNITSPVAGQFLGVHYSADARYGIV